jgi:uncharacterized OsmC-like protein
MSERFSIGLGQRGGYRFEVRFDDPSMPPLVTDEPAPLGAGAGPNPARLLAAAVANCLAASLLFALRKFHNRAEPLRATAELQLVRNDRGRLRVGRIGVDIHIAAAANELKMLDRVLAQFDDYCIVTASVRPGIAVEVRVLDRDGVELTAGEPALRAVEAGCA